MFWLDLIFLNKTNYTICRFQAKSGLIKGNFLNQISLKN